MVLTYKIFKFLGKTPEIAPLEHGQDHPCSRLLQDWQRMSPRHHARRMAQWYQKRPGQDQD